MNARRRSFIRKIIYLSAIIPLLFALSWLGRPATSGGEDREASPGGQLAKLRAKEDLDQSQWGEIDRLVRRSSWQPSGCEVSRPTCFGVTRLKRRRRRLDQALRNAQPSGQASAELPESLGVPGVEPFPTTARRSSTTIATAIVG